MDLLIGAACAVALGLAGIGGALLARRPHAAAPADPEYLLERWGFEAGGLYVLSTPFRPRAPELEHLRAIANRALVERSLQDVTLVVVPLGVRLEHLTDAQLGQLGLARVEART